MNTRFPLLALLAGLAIAAPARAQSTSPNCNLGAVFTNAGANKQYDNRSTLCTAWQLSYVASGYTTIAIELDAAPDVNGAPGTWTAVLTLSSPTGASGSWVGTSSWLRVNLTSAVGSGNITVVAGGYLQNPGTASAVKIVSNDPTGQGCTTGTSPGLIFNGNLYTCQGGTYTLYPGSATGNPPLVAASNPNGNTCGTAGVTLIFAGALYTCTAGTYQFYGTVVLQTATPAGVSCAGVTNPPLIQDGTGNLFSCQSGSYQTLLSTSSLIYNQGSPGAVSRSITSKLQEQISLKDFGAVGDGVTPDDNAVAAALAKCVGYTAGTRCIINVTPSTGCYFLTHSIMIGDGGANHYVIIDFEGQQQNFSANGPISPSCFLQSNLGQDVMTVNITTSASESFTINGVSLKYPTGPPNGSLSMSGNVATAVGGSFDPTWYNAAGHSSIWIQNSSTWGGGGCPGNMCDVLASTATTLTLAQNCTSGCPSSGSPAAWGINTAFRSVNPSQQLVGSRFSNMTFQNAGVCVASTVGFQSSRFNDASFFGCGIGFNAQGYENNIEFDNVTFQGGQVAVDVPTGGQFQSSNFINTVIEQQATAGIRVSGGTWFSGSMIGCWFEFPGADMIQLLAGNIHNVAFVGTQFDGSNQTGGRNVFANYGAFGGNAEIYDLTFNGGFVFNLNGGSFTYIANDPSGSNDPGYWGFTVLGTEFAGGELLYGFHTLTSKPNVTNFFESASFTPNLIVPNRVYSIPPPCTIMGAGLMYNCLSQYGGINPMWSRFKVTVTGAPGSPVFNVAPQLSSIAPSSAAAAASNSQFLTLFQIPGYSLGGTQGGSVKGIYIIPIVACTGTTNLSIVGFGTTSTNGLFLSNAGNQFVSSATYQSGLTVTGTTGQTLLLTLGNGSTGVVALTGTNTIAAGTPIIVSPGSGFLTAPTSANAVPGSAICGSCTATITSTLVSYGPPVLNFNLQNSVTVTNIFLSSITNDLVNRAVSNIGILLNTTSGFINALTNNCAWNVDVLWSSLP